MNCTYANMIEYNIDICQQFVHLLQVGLTQSNLSSILIVFCQFFTWSALGDLDLHFSLLLVTKAMLLKGKLHQPCDCVTNIISPRT